MKIKVKKKEYSEVLKLDSPKRYAPVRILFPLRFLLKAATSVLLAFSQYNCNQIGMEKLGKDEPCLVLMNHSSFIDLEIAVNAMYPRAFNIICTNDTLVGKGWLIRLIGCIPTTKFVFEANLVKDMVYAVRKLNSSVLMYPEAGYSFDGTATTIPDSLGKLVKLLKVPVVVIRTHGAFLRDPLYNNLQVRKVKVTADMEYVLSPEEIEEKTAKEINEILREQFSFDEFRWQQENEVKVKEKFRADYLNRVLYKCPHCNEERQMVGKGITISCESCGKGYELTEFGALKALGDEGKFDHIPDWYRWERECVRKELEEDTYRLDVPVDIYVMVDTKCVYHVGEGNLTHTKDGFHLTGCDGELDYTQKPNASYSINSDFNWYEIGDTICVGNEKIQYYCFPKDAGDVVAKTRLAVEELYKMTKKRK